jgi:hypothetical protein
MTTQVDQHHGGAIGVGLFYGSGVASPVSGEV